MNDNSKTTKAHTATSHELPSAMLHKMSMKWLTFESLRVLCERLSAQTPDVSVLLFTNLGLVQGRIADIADSYEESIAPENIMDKDATSAIVHLRSELWNMYASADRHLESPDTGALLHIVNARLRIGNRRVLLPHVTLFATDILGFSIVEGQLV